MLDQQTLPVFFGTISLVSISKSYKLLLGTNAYLLVELLNCCFLWAILWQTQVCVDEKAAHQTQLVPWTSARCHCGLWLPGIPGAASSGQITPSKRVMDPLHWPLEQDQLSQVIGLLLWNNLMTSVLLCAPESSRKVCALQQ